MTAEPTSAPQYKPGDVANGHVLTDQGQWVPTGQLPPAPGQYGAPAAQDHKPKKPLWKRWWVILLAVIILIAVIVNLGGGGDAGNDEEPAAVEEPAEVVEEEEPAVADEPAEEDASDQEAPAEEPEPEANYYAETYPVFEQVVVTGTGDSVVPVPAAIGVVTSTHDGSANFAVIALDAANESTGDLIVNTIGAYSGTGAYGLSAFGEATSLEVTADGNWSITITPISAAPVQSLPATGAGDVVFLYDGDADVWAITHDGDANIAVIQYTDDLFGANLLVNDIGAYEGSVPSQAGPSVVVISANGNWSITPQ